MKIQFEVIGIPKPQARPRVFVNKGKVFAHSPKTSYFESIKTSAYEQRIKANKQLSGALDLSLIFLLPYPKSMSQKKKREKHYITTRPDIDNYIKAVMDAINNSSLWADDSQVAVLTASKQYSNDVSRTIIEITELEFLWIEKVCLKN